MPKDSPKYIPALNWNLLTPLYDRLIRCTMPESAFKRRLVEQARIEKGHRVLDLGCGTATLTIRIKRLNADAEVFGLDGDPKVLKLAARKVDEAGLEVRLDQGIASQLPYPDSSFGRVLSSLFFHHLSQEDRRRSLREAFRVLHPGGELHLGDFGPPGNALMYLISLVMRHFEEYSDNIKGLLPTMIQQVGFGQVAEYARYSTLYGTLCLYRALKPGPESPV